MFIDFELSLIFIVLFSQFYKFSLLIYSGFRRFPETLILSTIIVRAAGLI